jgi:type II restriction/modification system DNA methylase subunit YeeA
MSRNKVTKELLPAATEIFTPDWVVRYMVDNSLGRLWIEGHPDSKIKFKLRYYLENPAQDSNEIEKLNVIDKEYATLSPQDIRCIDPCSGSGHICTYLFDVLMAIYEDYGIQSSDAVRYIIAQNLWGLDIDNRAAQLAYFSVMMKAVQYDSRFLRRKDNNGQPIVPQPHIYSIRESKEVDSFAVNYFINNDVKIKNSIDRIINPELFMKVNFE